MLSNAALEGGRGRSRLPLVDAARGAAVVAMAIYHTGWDLSELRLIETVVTAEAAWRFFARATAASFLVLTGIGLVLAHGDSIRWRPFARRFAVVAGAAFLISLATLFVFPESYIFFGVLHHIAVASVLALPFLRGPAAAAIAAAVLVWAAPLLLTQPIFDLPALAFLGLGTRLPNTNDWVPVFPWFGFVLAGVALARIVRPFIRKDGARPSRPVGALAWLGRHSLVIYLLHQPLIFGALSGVAAVTGPNPAAEAAPFRRNCEASCAAADQSAPLCRATCDCTIGELKRENLWAGVVQNRLDPEQSRRVGALARTCLARDPPPPE